LKGRGQQEVQWGTKEKTDLSKRDGTTEGERGVQDLRIVGSVGTKK